MYKFLPRRGVALTSQENMGSEATGSGRHVTTLSEVSFPSLGDSLFSIPHFLRC